MNRRDFLKRFGIGVTAALALTALPQAALAGLDTTQAGKRLAVEHLRLVFNEWCRVHKLVWPRVLHVSPGLFAAYEGELAATQRFATYDPVQPIGLMFKGAIVRPDRHLTDWDVVVVENG